MNLTIMEYEVKDLITGSASDILLAANFPATGFIVGTGSVVLNRLLKRRIEKARDIALEEIRSAKQSNLSTAEADEFVAIVYRYLRAAQEGAATLNLRLMAKIMRGQFIHKSLYASDFLALADILSSLRRDEVVYLATLLKLTRKGKFEPKKNQPGEFFGSEQSVSIQMRKILVGSDIFPRNEDLNACQAAVQRTGLIYRWDFTADGGVIFAPSSRLFALGELVDIEEALKQEDSQN